MGNLIDDFHQTLYDSGVWLNTRWLGVPILKIPLDLHIYQEIIYDVKPDVIIETGTYLGGSALFFASILDLLGHGRVISVDPDPGPNLPVHPRIQYVRGATAEHSTLELIRAQIQPWDVVLVSLDSEHARDHVLQELHAYQGFVSIGSYLVVEDTNVNGHPVLPNFGPGPSEALEEFLNTNHHFEIDESRHKYKVSFHRNGFLKRVKESL